MTMTKIDNRTRREIATEVWRVFALISPRVAIAYYEDGITIKVPFHEPVDLDGPQMIAGVAKGYHEWEEVSY
jgi:hypothetical protein